ncbi:MAG: hypothetical protein HYZ32_00905, partial [Hydrocarboniphaga effusa]|nr:hypothetical protein [Hydrocarboniphaga effusa]
MKSSPIGLLCFLLAACGENAVETSAPLNTSGQELTPVTVGTSGNEPLLAAAADGTLYITALQYLYRSTDGGASWIKLPGPPLLSTVLASDSAIAFDPSGRIYFSFDYPYAGTTAVCTSDDRGDSWFCNPAVVPGGTDRMWVTAPTDEAAYVVSNLGLYQTAFLASSDRGQTWTVTKFGNGLLAPQTGPLLQKPAGVEVLQPAKMSAYSFYAYAVSDLSAALSDTRTVGIPNPYALPSAAFDGAGLLYTASESERGEVQVARSGDEARSWNVLPPVPQTRKGTAVFSWLAAGAAGHVGVIYYHTPDNIDPNVTTDAVWSAWWAESFNADAAEPDWSATLLEEKVHTGRI